MKLFRVGVIADLLIERWKASFDDLRKNDIRGVFIDEVEGRVRRNGEGIASGFFC
jgi:hypothetical protein